VTTGPARSPASLSTQGFQPPSSPPQTGNAVRQMVQAPKVRPGDRPAGRVRALLRNPLYYSSYALVANTAATTALGVAYWAIAAHFYDRQTVGRSAALVSALILVSTFAQLNLANTLPRFIPQAGRSAGKFIAYSYAACSGAALIAGLTFVTILPRLSAQWRFLGDSLPLGIAFVAAATVWGVFNLQDVALLSLHRPVVVPVENFVYGVCKLAMLVGVIWLLPSSGIFFSWVLPLAITIPAVNWLIFRRYLKDREAAREPSRLNAREIVRFASVDYLGGVLAQGSGNLLPLLVLSTLGATANSGFYIAWTIASGLGLIALNFGTSLLVEGAAAPHRLAELTRGVLTRCLVITSLGAGLLLIAARPILHIYGSGYVGAASSLLGLLAVGTIPSCLVVIAMSLDRMAGRVGRATLTRFVLAVFVLSGSWMLLKKVGIDGVAYAWGGSNLVVAIARFPTIAGAAWGRAAQASMPSMRGAPAESLPRSSMRTQPASLRSQLSTRTRSTGLHRHSAVGRHRAGSDLRTDRQMQPSRGVRPQAPRATPSTPEATADTMRAIELLISMSNEAGFPS
jgi:O-antigen/teichoic acid export membrane protein